MKRRLACALIALLLPSAAFAEDETPKNFEITMKNHEFTPLELVVPSGQSLKITVKNEDPAPFEFESVQLHREKIVQPGDKIVLLFYPLQRGTYRYVNDFDRSAKGFITVK